MDQVWIREQTSGFVLGRISELIGDGAEVVPIEPKYSKAVYSFDDIFQAGDPTKDVDDNCEMLFLNEATILNNIKNRYYKDKIYSYVTNILIAVNPYKQIPDLYGPEMMEKYHGKDIGQLPPHVFAIADKAARDVRSLKQSQSIIVSGESGAGKTESTKHLLRFLCDNQGSSGTIEQNILEANPVLEAFGNAKTTRNNNSSRFGKFIEIHYNDKFNVVGGFISHYLLEKSRICSASGDERSYHIFYILLGGAPKDLREKLKLTQPDDFYYLNRGCTRYFTKSSSETKLHSSQKSSAHSENGPLRDNLMDDIESFSDLDKALSIVGLTDNEKLEIYSTVAAVLHLGNVQFEEVTNDTRGSCTVSEDSEKSLSIACELLGIDQTRVRQALVYKSMQSKKGLIRGTLIMVPLKVTEANNARDALAKAIYSKLFDYIVHRINKSIPFTTSSYYIGVLDIAGFEFFTVNSFEQFCINYCNEKLQQFFNEKILKYEVDLYTREAIDIPEIKFIDNQDCIDLIETPKKGIFTLLDEESKMPKPSFKHFTTEVFTKWSRHFRLDFPRSSKLQAHRNIRDDEGFLIRHFAGAVCYETGLFIEKNNDALHASLEELVQQSQNELIKSFFKKSTNVQTGKLTFVSVGSKFKTQLAELMEKLKDNGTNFIRCIKPNLNMVERKFDGPVCLTQLKSSGVIHALDLMKHGYPSRAPFAEVYSTYSSYFPEEVNRLRPKSFCEALLYSTDLSEENYKFGITRVFFKLGKFSELDKIIRSNPEELKVMIRRSKQWLARSRWIQSQFGILVALKFKKDILLRRAAATKIQQFVRGYLARKYNQPRVKGLKKVQSLNNNVKQLEMVALDIKSNKKNVTKNINNLKNEIEKLISKIKNESKLSEDTIDALYNQLASKTNKYINELRKRVTEEKNLDEDDKLKEIEENMKQESKINEKEERWKRTKQINRSINFDSFRKKKQEELERKKKDDLDKQRIAELQAEIARLADEEQKLRELLELERQDHEVALRLAGESNGKVDESSQIFPRLEAIKQQKRVALYGKAKMDLSKWKYFELRNILVSSPADAELLEACKYEFHRRLKIYHEWRLKNKGTTSTDVNDEENERIPQNITKTKLRPVDLDNHDNKARYFRVALRKSGSKDPRERGWWYVHFQGQYVVRQMHLLPNKRPILLVAGKDDLQMCELSLEETGLLKKRNAVITETEFETQWEHYGGKPYISNQ